MNVGDRGINTILTVFNQLCYVFWWCVLFCSVLPHHLSLSPFCLTPNPSFPISRKSSFISPPLSHTLFVSSSLTPYFLPPSLSHCPCILITLLSLSLSLTLSLPLAASFLPPSSNVLFFFFLSSYLFYPSLSPLCLFIHLSICLLSLSLSLSSYYLHTYTHSHIVICIHTVYAYM